MEGGGGPIRFFHGRSSDVNGFQITSFYPYDEVGRYTVLTRESRKNPPGLTGGMSVVLAW